MGGAYVAAFEELLAEPIYFFCRYFRVGKRRRMRGTPEMRGSTRLFKILLMASMSCGVTSRLNCEIPPEVCRAIFRRIACI